VERILAWYRVGSSVGAVVALVVANAIPLIGVLFLGWSVWNILVIYWLENGIVGAFNVLKMARADGSAVDDPLAVTMLVNGRPAAGLVKFAIIPFFVVHYGLFWVVHGVFVLTLPLFASLSGESFGTSMTLSGGSITFAVIALAVSHGLSFWWNFLRGGEYRRTTAAGLMFAPYRRLIALHLTIIFGALAILVTGAPAAAIAVLVAVKILLDLGLHLAEHRPGTQVAPSAPGTVVRD
jgi:Family of unknown function (DUF6498)